jgi:predicted negative regulator of RcsB-dependent stress response
MDNEVKNTADFYRLVAWAHARRKQLIWISVTVVAVGLIVGVYTWHKNYNESMASESLSKLKLPASSEPATATGADPYLKLASDYPGTRAAARALLIAGGILFDANKFKEAQSQFEKFLAEYGDFSLASQAAIGVAACLEAQGKLPEAASRYDDIVKRHSMDPTAPQAKSSLARIYVAQNKPELAFELYQQMAQANNQDSWSSEAGIQAEELLLKYPNLRKPAPAPAAPAPSATSPTLNLPKK